MPTIREKTQLMSGPEIDRTLTRLAHEIIEKNDSLEKLTLIGVRRRGVPLANRLAEKIAQLGQQRIPVGVLDITFYRDDLSTVGQKPVVQPCKIECPITDRDVILVDDVLYTGRTTRAALDALFDCGRPRRVQLLALIDRGHRELPIEARYVGKYVETSDSEIIEVKLQEVDQAEKVMLVERVD